MRSYYRYLFVFMIWLQAHMHVSYAPGFPMVRSYLPQIRSRGFDIPLGQRRSNSDSFRFEQRRGESSFIEHYLGNDVLVEGQPRDSNRPFDDNFFKMLDKDQEAVMKLFNKDQETMRELELDALKEKFSYRERPGSKTKKEKNENQENKKTETGKAENEVELDLHGEHRPHHSVKSDDRERSSSDRSNFSLHQPSPAPSVENISVNVATDKPVFIVEDHYLSFNIDFEMFYYDKDPWIRFNLTSPRLVTILKGLSPAIWRIGGTDCAYTLFDVPKEHLDAAELKPRGLVMTPEKLTEFIKVTQASGNRFLYDLNLQLRLGSQWNPDNAIRMFDYIQSQGFGENLDFELGNEPTGYPMSPEQMAEDFVALHKVMLTYPNLASSRIVGPDAVGIKPGSKGYKVMNALASRAGDFLKAITFHQYYFRGTQVTYKDYINPKYFSMLVDDIHDVQSAIQTSAHPNTAIWIGETSDGWDRGTQNVSDRYVSGFLWLDKLGLSARMGVGVVMRQTLRHGNYEMIGDYLQPNPDYWLSLLHKRLVGTRVLNVDLNSTSSLLDPPTTRVYAHCTRLDSGGLTPTYPPGSVTLFALNVSPTTTKSLHLPLMWTKSSTDLYLLSPPHGDILSQQVQLNDQVLKLISDTELPQLKPLILQPGQTFNIPPLTFAFLVVPQAKAQACL